MKYKCEFEGDCHHGEVLTIRPKGWRFWQRNKHICQAHLAYVCWDYTILLDVCPTDKKQSRILKAILVGDSEIWKLIESDGTGWLYGDYWYDSLGKGWYQNYDGVIYKVYTMQVY